MRRRFTLVAAAIAAAAVLAPTAATVPPVKDSSFLREAVTVDGIREHQAAFQAIADANGGTRASGTSGFDASVDYVVDRLTAAGYRPTVQEFEFAFFQQTGPSAFDQVSPTPTTYAEGPDFALMDYSGDGEVTGTLVPTNDVIVPMDPAAPASTSNSGCEAADFPVPPDATSVALIQRGTCTFEVKVANATAAGYAAVVFFNEGQPGRQDAFVGTIGNPAAIPAVMATYALGAALYGSTQSGPVTVHVATETISETRTAANVIAETRHGKAARTIVVGAHLDSVLEGPGINDNGSGSAAILEIAEEFSELKLNPKNKLRFIWFGAEENNLLGSEHYVSQLSADELSRIALMLNFDMIGSKNYVRFVYDGDGAPTGTAGPAGSDADRGRLRQLLRLPGAGDGADRVRRPLRLRAVHRRRNTGRRSLHRRRGSQDARAGRDLRRHGRRAVRPVLPRGVRHVRQRLAGGARPDVGRRRRRDLYVRVEEPATRAWGLGSRERRVSRQALEPARRNVGACGDALRRGGGEAAPPSRRTAQVASARGLCP